MKRLFIAIKIIPDENMLKQYYSLREALSDNKIVWVEPDKFHLTLKFLGDTSQDSINIVNNIIIDTLESKRSFDIEFKNTGIFGSKYDPRVIWFGISENHEFLKLGNDLLNNLHDGGFKRDRQNFVPHLTIGRIKRIEDKMFFNRMISNFRNVYLQRFTINKVILYESILRKEGPVYKVVSSYELIDKQ